MNDSWAIGLRGHSTIGTRVRFVISSVSVPSKPGSTKPAVAWTISPRRPRLDLPSIRATTSSGSRTHSSVRPRTNSPGWITNGSASPTSISSVRRARRVVEVDRGRRGGCGRRGTTRRGAGRPRPAAPSRGPTARSRSGPASTRRRIVPSESTEVGPRHARVVCQPARRARYARVARRDALTCSCWPRPPRARSPSKTLFYVLGGALAVWAVLVSAVGIARHATFPPDRGRGDAGAGRQRSCSWRARWPAPSSPADGLADPAAPTHGTEVRLRIITGRQHGPVTPLRPRDPPRSTMATQEQSSGDGGVATATDSLTITDNRTGRTYDVPDRGRHDPRHRAARHQGRRRRLRPHVLRPGVPEHRVVSLRRSPTSTATRGSSSTAATRSSSSRSSPPTSRSPTC